MTINDIPKEHDGSVCFCGHLWHFVSGGGGEMDDNSKDYTNSVWLITTLPDQRVAYHGPFGQEEIRAMTNFLIAHLPEGTVIEMRPVVVL